MANIKTMLVVVVACIVSLALSACAHHQKGPYSYAIADPLPPPPPPDYSTRLPNHIASNENTILIDPNVHAWGAYSQGKLVRAGLATAGSNWCADIKRPCRTKAGTFRVKSLGHASCKSSIYPLPRGGAPMPYCMFFNGHQGLHGSYQVVEGNVSHGCVRLKVADAEWLRFNFVRIGTKVIVEPY